MAIERYYTPQALAKATGLAVEQCRSLIKQSPDRICVSRNPGSLRPRWAISEKGFRELTEKHRRKALQQQQDARAAARSEEKPERKRNIRLNAPMAGMNPDGTIMNSRQLKAAGLWKGA